MAIRIIINDKECTNPVVKYGLALAAVIGTIAVAALIIFVFLPVIGISVAATLGLFIVLAVGVFAGAVALTLGSAILAAIMVLIESISGKSGSPK